MTMNGRIVAREIEEYIWPLLRDHGFAKFTSKSAWRYLPEQVHVINFQSFNSYLAEGIGCRTFSFAVNLGIYFPCIPPMLLEKGPQQAQSPLEWQCHFRNRLLKRLDQPVLPRREIWFVDSDGSNLSETITDARRSLAEDGLPWFDKFASLDEVLVLLLEDALPPEVASPSGSPARKHKIGHIARSLGKHDIADAMISESEKEMTTHVERLQSALRSAGRRRSSRTSQ